MQSDTLRLRLLSFLLATALVLPAALGRCNTCNKNGVACIDDTKFYLCFGGDIQYAQIFSCPKGKVCSDSDDQCTAQGAPACMEAKSDCGVCDDSKMFTCTSRFTFAQCNGTALLPETTGNCSLNLVCDSTQAEICMPEWLLPLGPECDNELEL